MRRRSTLQTERPDLTHINNLCFHGPLSPQEYERNALADGVILQSLTDGPSTFTPLVGDRGPDSNERDGVGNSQQNTNDALMNDNSSEATLVSKADTEQGLMEGTTEEEQQSILENENKENLSPDKAEDSSKNAAAQSLEPLASASQSELNTQAGAISVDTALAANETNEQPMKYQPPPGKPPLVPPRKPVENATTTLEEYARQQDVTEVMNHCIIALSCAIRPTGIDKSGEQQDEIHDLLYGQLIRHSQPPSEAPRSEPFLNILTRVYHQPTDVYAAIDSDYDLQDTAKEGTKSFTSIARLPPVLSIALDRVSWNQESKRQEKLNYHVDVPETIYMDRYLESASNSELMQRRQQTWEIKKELAILSARRSILEQKRVGPACSRKKGGILLTAS